MTKDKIKIYIIEILLLLILFFTLFVQNIFNRIYLAIFLFVFMLCTVFILKKRKEKSIYSKQVMLMMFIFAFIYLTVFYLMGLYFGYYKATVQLSLWSFEMFIIPFVVIIVSSEIIRYVFLSQEVKGSSLLSFLSMVLIDLVIYSNAYDISKLDEFLMLLGFIFFASIACNLLYNYISKRYGYMPIIIYRLITILYIYVIPIIPDVYIFFRSVLRMIYPYIIFLVLDYSFGKNESLSPSKTKKWHTIVAGFTFVISVVIVMLVSCMFRWGIIVVGSGSMTGTINKGDAVVFESYENVSEINVDDVIIFVKDNLKIVHRVIDKKNINGEIRYYTKGDANQQQDDWYVTENEIIGVVNFKVKYIGWPSLWVRDIFS